jgi:hypothetical protein
VVTHSPRFVVAHCEIAHRANLILIGPGWYAAFSKRLGAAIATLAVFLLPLYQAISSARIRGFVISGIHQLSIAAAAAARNGSRSKSCALGQKLLKIDGGLK